MAPIAILNRLPNLRTSNEEERYSAWLELFFDLVFVFAITELAQYLHEHHSIGGILSFLGLFVPVWWTWTGFSFYADQFDPDTVLYRLVMFGAMLLTIMLAVNLQSALDPFPVAFIVSYVALQLLLGGLYLWACRDANVRPMFLRFALGFIAAGVLWLVSLWVPTPFRYWLWALALLIELITPALSHVHTKRLQPRVSHIPERLGVFTLIVLGEAVVVVGSGLTDIHWQILSVSTAIVGFLIAACIWWLYFDRIDTATLSYGLAGDRRKIMQAFVWSYLHFFVFAGITAVSVGIELAIKQVAGVSQEIFCLGIFSTLLAMSIIHQFGPAPLARNEIIARTLTLGIAIILLWIPVSINSLLLIGLFAFLLICTVACEAYHFTVKSTKHRRD